MKKVIVMFVLLSVFFAPKLSFSQNDPPEKVNIQISSQKMKIIENGRISDRILLVDLGIYEYKGKIYVNWDHVVISLLEDEKKIYLRPQHFSVDDGSIKDFMLNKNSFSFMIDLGLGRSIQIVGNKEGPCVYSIGGVGLWWSDICKTKIKIEWRSTYKKIVLPYKEVYGFSPPCLSR